MVVWIHDSNCTVVDLLIIEVDHVDRWKGLVSLPGACDQGVCHDAGCRTLQGTYMHMLGFERDCRQMDDAFGLDEALCNAVCTHAPLCC
jgi:NADH:ubiquinone oxidoreductase subunit E